MHVSTESWLWGSTAVLLTLALLIGACASTPEEPPTPYLDAAQEVAQWLQTQADASGRIPDVAGDTTTTASLGTGAAGRALFFLELYAVTADPSYLQWARSEGEAAYLQRNDDSGSPGLYNGGSGIAFTLSELHRVTGEASYRIAALDVMLTVAASTTGIREETPLPNDVIVGAAGVGLAALHLAEALEEPTFTDIAVMLGDTLLARAIPADGGSYWKRAEHLPHNLPNFSHGTAGVGYYMARLFEATQEVRYLTAAEQAAQYLEAVADQTEALFLVPYGIPNEGFVTAFDIGWAHGPVGTVRLFSLLHQLTEDPHYANLIDANLRTLLATGLPGPTTDASRWTGPFAIDQRFGTAGAIPLLLAHQARNSAFATRSQEIADAILQQSQVSADGRFWRLPTYGFQQAVGDSASYTGYFYGAAGLGLALLHQHEAGRSARVRLPDDPFGQPEP